MPKKLDGLPYVSRDLFDPSVRRDVQTVEEAGPKKRGRPKGSKNKKSATVSTADIASCSAVAAPSAAQASEGAPCTDNAMAGDVGQSSEQADPQTPQTTASCGLSFCS